MLQVVSDAKEGCIPPKNKTLVLGMGCAFELIPVGGDVPLGGKTMSHFYVKKKDIDFKS